MTKKQVALGLMSGTSLDGVDIALIESDGAYDVQIGGFMTVPYHADERRFLRNIVTQAQSLALDWHDKSTWPEAIKQADQLVTHKHIDAVQIFLRKYNETIDLIGFHGQTVLHRPQDRLTVQLGDARALADAVGINIIADMRQADILAGGQGAPLAPLFHAALAHELPKPLCVVNIGGVANVTYIGADGKIIAFDSGPGNALLDDWVKQHDAGFYDAGGRLARQGQVDNDFVQRFLRFDYFLKTPPKSLDRLDFTNFYETMNHTLEDGAATLGAFTYEAILAARMHFPQEPVLWVICGGGRHNDFLMAHLHARLNVPLNRCEAYGWHGDALEAQAFAWLAIRSLYDLPLSLPTTTGVPHPLSGGVLYKPQ